MDRSDTSRSRAWIIRQPYAHRGLHGHKIPENSRAACAAAIARDVGIEIDTILSADGEAFVFHDDMLDRLTAEHGPAEALSSAQLAAIRLRGSDETIPTLTEILGLINGQVPLLIEVKSPPGSAIPIEQRCAAVHRALQGYEGAVAVMSFDPRVGRWLSTHAPSIIRGLVVTEQHDTNFWLRLRGRIFRRQAQRMAIPDFLALDIRDLPSATSRRARTISLPILTWTVKSPKDERVAVDYADEIIFEEPGPGSPIGLLE